MTRWKREFRAWADREKLRVTVVPKSWQDWECAKLLSIVTHRISLAHDADRAFTAALLYGGYIHSQGQTP